MRIGLTTAAFYGRLETEDAAAQLADLPIDCCEVFFETFSEYSTAFGALVKKRLRRVPAVSMHVKTQHFEGDIFGQSKRQRKDAFNWLTRAMEAGQAVGARIYVYHGPQAARDTEPPYAAWQDAIQEAVAVSAAHGIQFAWETVSWCTLRKPERVRTLRSLVPQLKFVLDTKQVLEMGQNPLDYIDAMGDALCHVHVLDVDGKGGYALPGPGGYDFPTLGRVLRDNGYKGDVILEPYGRMVREAGDLLAPLSYLRKAFGVG